MGLAASRRRRRRGRRIRAAVSFGVFLALGLAAVLVFSVFGFQFFEVPSGSMLPTLRIGDRILVRKIALDRADLHAGQIVVFRRPPYDTVDVNIADVVKRIVAVPGQTVSSSGGHLLVNGRVVSEGYLPKGTSTTNVPREVVPSGDYFVMGDNRGDSYDSRYFGPIKATSVIGVVVAQVWPPWAFRIF